jgi:hypothetical protein
MFIRLYSLLYMLLVGVNLNCWHQTHFMWNFGCISRCNKGVPSNPYEYFSKEQSFDRNLYKNICLGNIVWVESRHAQEFCKQVLPNLNQSIILLVSAGDESFPKDCKGLDINVLLNNKFIVHIFAQNNVYSGESKKISSFPIGMDYHTVAYKSSNGGWGEKGNPNEQELSLNEILKRLRPTSQRLKPAFVDFHHSDTAHAGFERYLEYGEDRKFIFERLLPTGLIHHSKWMRRSEMWKKKGKYAFSISPHGNGLDCHRTWEDLILGCIVIVKSSPLDVLYEGLPVVIVNDWSEVTKENMASWINKYSNAFTDYKYRQRLTSDYWWSKIYNLSQKIKAGQL